MNWTEGNLARHSRNRPRNQLLARQKRHFAKARSSLYNNDILQTPSTLSLLGFEVTTRPRGREGTGCRYPSSPHQHGHTLGTTHHHEIVSPVSRDMQRDQTQTIRQGTTGGSDGLRSRSPCSRVGSLNSTTTTCSKKRKLLQQPDWAGLSAKQPDELVFSRPIDTTDKSPWTKRALRKDPRTPKYHPRAKGKPNVDIPHYQPIEILQQDQLGLRELSADLEAGKAHNMSSDSTAPQIAQRGYRLPHQELPTSSPRSSEAVTKIPRPTYNLPRINGDLTTRHDIPSMTSSNLPFSSDYLAQELESRNTASEHEMGNPRIAYAASDIYHPTPCRGSKSALLQWSPRDSEDIYSTEAQVGRDLSDQHSSEVDTRNAWNDWLMPTGRSSRSDTLCQSPAEHISMDPGAGTIESYIPSRHQCDASEAYLDGDSIFHINSAGASTNLFDKVSKSPSEDGLYPGLYSPEVLMAPAGAKPDKTDIKLPGETIHSRVPKSPANDNSAWMDFILGNGSTDLEEAIREAKSQVVYGLHPSDSPNRQATPLQSFIPEVEKVYHVAQDASTSSVIDHHRSGDSSLYDPSASHVATQHTTDLDEPAADNSPEMATETDTKFRFVPPKPFIGRPRKPATTSKTGKNDVASRKASRTRLDRRGKGKSNKRRGKKYVDTRADIREIPDFSGDPIEDFVD